MTENQPHLGPSILRKLRPVAIVAAALSTLAGIGCSGTSAPSVRVTDVRVTDRTDEAVALDFLVETVNRNDDELPLRSADYALFLDGKSVFRGSRSPEATLRRADATGPGVQFFVLPAVVKLEDVPSQQARYRLAGTLRYTGPSELADVLFDARIIQPKVEFNESGEIDIAASPVIQEPGQ